MAHSRPAHRGKRHSRISFYKCLGGSFTYWSP
jgi:hypothetical protein